MKIGKVRVMQDRAKRQQVGVAIQDKGSVDAGDGLENRRRQIEQALVAKQIVKLILREMPGWRLLAWRRRQQVGGGNEPGGGVRVIEHDKKAAATIFHEVQRGREQGVRQSAVAESLPPETIFLDRVRDPPAPIQESKDLYSVCEDFHLAS